MWVQSEAFYASTTSTWVFISLVLWELPFFLASILLVFFQPIHHVYWIDSSCTFLQISLPYCDWGTKDEYSKCSQSQHIICAMVSLYSIFVAKDEKTRCILNPFFWSICNDCYAFIQACVTNRVPLFDHVRLIEVTWFW